MKYFRYLSIILLLITNSCSKKTPADPSSAPHAANGFMFDNQISENIGINHMLLVTALNEKEIIGVSSTGTSYNSPVGGIRVMRIDKTTGVQWIKNLDAGVWDQQLSVSATIDSQQNLWIGGYIFGGFQGYGKPYVVKADKDGNVLFSMYLPYTDKYGDPRTFELSSIKALANGDVLLESLQGSVQLVRMKSTGEIVWAEELITPNQNFVITGMHRNQIVESNNGDLLIATTGIAATGSLFKLKQDGSIIYAKSYSYSSSTGVSAEQLISLPSGDVMLTGHFDYPNRKYPFFMKFESSTGSVKLAKSSPPDAYPISIYLNDIQQVNDQFIMTVSVDRQYNTILMDNDLNVLKYTRSLGKQNVFGGGHTLFYDKSSNSLYHLLDDPGPSGGTGFQFIKTDLTGTTCQNYSTQPIQLKLQSFLPTVSDLDVTISKQVVLPVSLKWTVTSTAFKKVSECE